MNLQKYNTDPIANQLIKAGTFEVDKYHMVHDKKWSDEVKTLDIRTIEQAVKSATPSLSTYRKYKGPEVCIMLVSKMLMDLAGCFNVGNNLKTDQLHLTARLILKKFYFLTLADLRLCFDRAICGEYGEQYNRLDTQVILIWLGKYDEQRVSYSHLAEQKKKDHRDKKPMTINREGLKKIGEFHQVMLQKGIIKERYKPVNKEKEREGQREASNLVNNRKEFTEDEKREMQRKAEELMKNINNK